MPLCEINKTTVVCAACHWRWRRGLIPSPCMPHFPASPLASKQHAAWLCLFLPDPFAGLSNLRCSPLCCLQFSSVWSEMWGPGGNRNGSSQQHSSNRWLCGDSTWKAALSSELLITSQVQTNGLSVWGTAARVMEEDNLIYGERLKELNR